MTTVKRTLLLLASGLLLSTAVFGQGRNLVPDEKSLKEYVAFLASDSLKGRDAGTPENVVAAYAIAQAFKKAGLQPFQTQRTLLDDEERALAAGFSGADSLALYFQNFTVTKSHLSRSSSFTVMKSEGTSTLVHSYNYPTDYYIQYAGQVGASAQAGVVFCGFGIVSGPDGYNDYMTAQGKTLDVKGKLVMVLDGYPGQENPAGPFAKARKPLYVNALRKAEAARDKGAAAILVVEARRERGVAFEQRYEKFKRSLHSDSYTLPNRTERNIPVIFINRKVAHELLAGSGWTLDSLYRGIEKTLKPNALALEGCRAGFDARFEVTPVPTKNVIGILPGKDSVLAKECVVIGGHFDHVGFGYHGSTREFQGKIHRGADDNASGTACVMELARVLASVPMKRTIVFAAFSAEEMGLLGSAFYVSEQPAMPLAKTVAMLNLDMVSRNSDSLLWLGGSFYSEDLRKIVEQENDAVGFNLLYNTGLLTFASDQGPFLRREIPAVFFFAGLHDDYHTPADTPEKLNYAKMARVARLAGLSAVHLANADAKPKYYDLPMSERKKLVDESVKRQRKFQKGKDDDKKEPSLRQEQE